MGENVATHAMLGGARQQRRGHVVREVRNWETERKMWGQSFAFSERANEEEKNLRGSEEPAAKARAHQDGEIEEGASGKKWEGK